MVDSKHKKQKRCLISEENVSTVLQRYTANTVLALLQEVAQFDGVKIDWNALVKKTSTGISNAREYQMLWRHLAYRHALLEKPDDGAQPLDEDSDLEYELEAYPSVSSEASTEAAACVKVMIASGLPSNSSHSNGAMVEAPLTINVPKGQSFKATSEKSQPAAVRGMNIIVPVSVQKLPLPSGAPGEGLDALGSTSGTYPPRRKRKPWSEAEDTELINAVKKFGEGNWATILRADFKGDRTASQLSQRWAIIRKRHGNAKPAAKGSSSLLHPEAQEAARRAMNLALDPPTKNTATNRSGGTPSNNIQSSTAPPTSASAASPAQQRPTGSKLSPSAAASNTVFSNRVSIPADEAVPAQHQAQQNTTIKKSSLGGPTSNNVSASCAPSAPLTDASPSQHQSRLLPIATVSSSTGPASYAGKSQAIPRKVSGHSPGIDPVTAVAIASGARVATGPEALQLVSGHNNNVHYFSTARSATSNACNPVGSSGSIGAGLMKASSQLAPHTPSRPAPHTPSASTTAVSMSSGHAITKLPPKQNAKSLTETKESGSEDVGKGKVQENGAGSSSGNESSIAVQDDKATLSNQESESRSEIPAVESASVSSTLEMAVGNLSDAIGKELEGSQNENDNNIMASPIKGETSTGQENGEKDSISVTDKRLCDLASTGINESSEKTEAATETVPGNGILDGC
ncbi:hypothetical protein Tsubulata_001939 [Turnera subulata]|uniref:Myb-like domain-containing protein n=1 Tax=Turnera subulata TaxID=218843 RepID=A0A9Q0FK29_9ROSI|nr:hypothetical protein Tsubulata_001939 [Turnera subulata]